jgi:hypothetical protein
LVAPDELGRRLELRLLGLAGDLREQCDLGARGLERWSDAGKPAIVSASGVDEPHTHNALDDAREQARIFTALRARARN